MPSYNVHEAKSNLSKLLAQTVRGVEVVIMRDGKPVAQLIPYQEKARAKKIPLGLWRDRVTETPGWENGMSD